MLKRYYGEAASLLDELLRTIRGLTYQHFAGQTVDTEPFRMAVWYYVHRVCGVFHDDFDYQRVNHLVQQKTKSYVKKVAINPFTYVFSRLILSLPSNKDTLSSISMADLNLGTQFQPEEKVHVALLAAESRRQASLLYALRGVSKYLATK